MTRTPTRRDLVRGLAASAAVAATGAAVPRTAAAAERSHVVLVALDGFDWEYLDGRAPLPNLRALLRRGAVARSTGVMASITNPSFTSISCGTWPDVTRNAAYYYDPAAGLVRGQSRDSAVEGLGQALRRQGVVLGSAQWFILQDKGASYGDPAGLYTQPGGRIDARVDDAVAMLTGQPVRSGPTTVTMPEPPDFLAVYSSDLDGDGHAHGPDSPVLLDTLVETDRALGRLVEAVQDADRFGRTTWLVTADHGMGRWEVPIGPDAVAALGRAGFTAQVLGTGGRPAASTDVVVVPGGSVASVHLLGDLAGSAAAAARVRAALAGLTGVSAVLDEDDQAALRMAPQYGELVVELAEGYAMALTPPREGSDGYHGGRRELSVPLVLAGHRVRPGVASRSPRHVDVAPTICHLLGVDPPAAAEGRVLTEALRG